MDNILYYLQNKYLGNWLDIYDSLQNREMINPENLKEIPENVITLLNPQYPEFLKKWYKPPFMVMKENDKWYYIYGKDLKEKFEIVEGESDSEQEKQYHENLNKICK